MMYFPLGNNIDDNHSEKANHPTFGRSEIVNFTSKEVLYTCMHILNSRNI